MKRLFRRQLGSHRVLHFSAPLANHPLGHVKIGSTCQTLRNGLFGCLLLLLVLVPLKLPSSTSNLDSLGSTSYNGNMEA